MRITVSVGFLLCGVVLAPAQETVTKVLERKLLSRVEAYDRETKGVIGMAAIDLRTGTSISYNGSVVFPQASVIKIPIMMEVYRRVESGSFAWNMPVELAGTDAVGGSGELQNSLRDAPVVISLRQLVAKMIHDSDNTATNKLIQIVGVESVNRWLAGAGLQQTRLQRRMMDSAAAAAGRENISTPLDMVRLLRLLYTGKAVSPQASAEMIDIMKDVKADFRAAIPGNTVVASKPGDLSGVRSEIGIVFLTKRPFALSVMSAFLDSGSNPVPAIVEMVFEHFQKLESSNVYGHKLQ